MRKSKTTASGVIFESALQVMEDVLDFTIQRHEEHQAAVAVYEKMRDSFAASRRNLRALLKKSWFRGPERQRCLARARELREAELVLGHLMKSSRLAADLDGVFLEGVGGFEGMKELMSRFKIITKDKKR